MCPFSINLLKGLLLKKVKSKALICDPSTSASVIIIIFPYLKSFKSISSFFGSKPSALIKVTISFDEINFAKVFVLISFPFPLIFFFVPLVLVYVFKINKGSKGIYIKDEKELENYIINNSKEFKKIKKGSKDFEKKLQEEKSKISLQRFKGLGEMNPEELWNTTLNPETRNLLQVKYSKDLKKDHKLIHTLMGNDVALRKDFIVENAINVSNLDI